MNAPLPVNEVERLQTLRAYNILDTPPEVAFNRITALAAQLFTVPIALVSLVDVDRQWFKACFGVDRRQTSRELSFCSHAILSDQVMVVPDAATDYRFSDNSLVTGPPYIRSYAGAPLRACGGHNIGSLCVIDIVPRSFGTQQVAMLEDMAALVVDELELRRTARQLRQNEALLRQSLRDNNQLATAVGNLKCGVLVTDPKQPDNPIIFANAGFCAMTGYSPEEVVGRNCRFLQGPLTDPNTLQQLRQAVHKQRHFTNILINYRKDGSPFVNELIIDPVFDETGQLLTFVGLQNDVTERENAKQLLEQRVRDRTADLALSQIEILGRLARAAEYRDDDTGQHTQRVAKTAALIAEAIGLPSDQIEFIRQAAPLHDVGKIAISDLILLKPGKLTFEELGHMRTHAAIGANLLSEGRSEVVQMAERIAGSHHERWDGKGYPNQLAGDQIPLVGRILSVADVFDALTHDRPYKKAWSITDAVVEITRQSGQHFDPRVVDAFLKLVHDKLV